MLLPAARQSASCVSVAGSCRIASNACAAHPAVCRRGPASCGADPDWDIDAIEDWLVDAIVDVFAVRHDNALGYDNKDANGYSDVKLVADANSDCEPHCDQHSDAIADIDTLVYDDILCDWKRHAYAIAVAGCDAQPSVFAWRHELLDWYADCVCCAVTDPHVDAVTESGPNFEPKLHWDDDPHGIAVCNTDLDAVIKPAGLVDDNCDRQPHSHAIVVAGSDAQPGVFARRLEHFDWDAGCFCAPVADHNVDAISERRSYAEPERHGNANTDSIASCCTIINVVFYPSFHAVRLNDAFSHAVWLKWRNTVIDAVPNPAYYGFGLVDPVVHSDGNINRQRLAHALTDAGSDAQPSVFARHHELLDWHTGCVCCAFADHFVDAVGDPKYHCQWDDDPNGISGLDADFDAVG